MLYLTQDPDTKKTSILSFNNGLASTPTIAEVKTYLSNLSENLIETKHRQEQLKQVFENPLITKDENFAIFTDPESGKKISIQNNDGTFEVLEGEIVKPHLSSAVTEALRAAERYIDQERSVRDLKSSHLDSFQATFNSREIANGEQVAKDFHRMPTGSFFRSEVGIYQDPGG